MAKQGRINSIDKNKVRKFIALVEKQGIKVSKAILFGSHARGSATQDSDIDLAVVSPQLGKDAVREMMFLRKLALGIDSRLEPVPFSPLGFRDRLSSLSSEIRQHGIVVT